MPGGVADVVELALPAAAKLMLSAERPLDGVGSVELSGHHDVLGLSEELRLRRSRHNAAEEKDLS